MKMLEFHSSKGQRLTEDSCKLHVPLVPNVSLPGEYLICLTLQQRIYQELHMAFITFKAL